MLLFAAGLRLWRVDQGLPIFYDEAIPFRRALDMWTSGGGIDWNPHFFHYPSLTLYLSLFVQQTVYLIGRARGFYANPADFLMHYDLDPAPVVIATRLVFLALDLLTVAVVLRVGERLRPGVGLLAGLVVAAVPGLVTSSYRISADTALTTFTMLALGALLSWNKRPSRARLVGLAVLIGCAVGAKFPGVALLAPLGLVLWVRRGWRGLGAWALTAIGAGVVFLVTTPFAVLDAGTFLRDLSFVRNLASEGHFGNFDRIGLGFNLRLLLAQLGWPAMALLAWSLFALLKWWLGRAARDGRALSHAPAAPGGAVPDGRAPPDPVAALPRAALWAALLAFFVPAALATVEAGRYLMPVLPVAALLAADAALALAARVAPPARRAATVALAVLLAGPVLLAGVPAAGRISEATRTAAARWIERNLGPHDLLVQEPYGAPALERSRGRDVLGSRRRLGALGATRSAFAEQSWKAVVTLPLAVVGRASCSVADRSGEFDDIAFALRIADINRAVYDLRLFAGVDYVLTSAAVRGRHAADAGRYPEAMRLYALLDATADRVARFAPRGWDDGPEILIYQLTPATRAVIDALGPLRIAWWTDAVAPQYAIDATHRMVGPAADPPERTVGADGEPVPWVASLAGLFADRWSAFALALGMEHLERDEPGHARRLSGAVLLMNPADVRACIAYAASSEAMDDVTDARRVIERSLRAVEAAGEPTGALRIEHARVLARLGDMAGARAALTRVAGENEPGPAAEAARLLETLDSRRLGTALNPPQGRADTFAGAWAGR